MGLGRGLNVVPSINSDSAYSLADEGEWRLSNQIGEHMAGCETRRISQCRAVPQLRCFGRCAVRRQAAVGPWALFLLHAHTSAVI